MNASNKNIDEKSIAVLLPSYIGGGAEKVTDLIFSGIIKRYGYSVELITGEINEITRRRAEKIGYKVTDLSEFGPDINEAKAEKAFLDALKNSDAKHIVFSVVTPNAIEQFRKELPNRNIIFHLHSMPLWQGREKILTRRRYILALDSMGKYLKWYVFKYLKEKWFKVYSRRFAKRYREIYKHVDHTVVLTDSYKREMNRIMGLKADSSNSRISTIYNPFDSEPFASLSTIPKRKEIVYIGRLSCIDKGVDHLLRAWLRIYQDYPDWTLKIVGDGPDRPYLEWLVYVMSLKRVEFCGYTPNPSEYLKTASILCLPSNFEGWPGVLIEAMASGVVPAAINCSGGVAEILGDGRGVLVPPGKDYLLAKGLRQLVDNPQELAERRKLYPDFLKKFDSEVAVEEFHKLLV